MITDEMNIFDIHTFHSFVFNVLGEELATTDIGIVRMNATLSTIVSLPRKELVAAVREALPQSAQTALISSRRYTRIIIDEAQDMTPEYYTLASNILKICRASLTLLGDPRQAIYQFNGATDKYLRNAHLYFDREFVDRTLSTSFRVPGTIATLVNEACKGDGGNDIVPYQRSGIKPMIYFESIYEKMDMIIDMIKKVPPEDVMILMYSTLRDSYRPSVTVANTLIDAGIPVCFNGIGEVGGSVLMISYHQSKGLERPIVVCLDMGEYYFGINPQVSRESLPNLWYVAMTRASRFLIVFMDKPFGFITRGLKAIGFTPPEPMDVTDNPRTPRDESIDGYIARGFDSLVKYAPTSVQIELMSRSEYPEGFNGIGVGGMSVSSGDLVVGVIREYTKARLLNASISPDAYLDEYKRVLLGGLRNIRLKMGVVTLGTDKMTVADAMDRGYEVAIHVISTLIHHVGKDSLRSIKGEYGNTEIATEDGTVIIISTGATIEARLRVASFWKMKVIVIDIIAGGYAILLPKDHAIE